MFCPNCGQQIPEGASFCPNCGTTLKKNTRGFDLPSLSLTKKSPSFALVIITMLQLLGAILTSFTPILGGPRYYDQLTPLIGWQRNSHDVYMRGYSDLGNTGETILVLTIIFLFIIVTCILMSFMKQWIKASAFLTLCCYVLYLIICRSTIKSVTGEASIKTMGWICVVIYSIAAFISIGFVGVKAFRQQNAITSLAITQRLAAAGFSGARLGFIACLVSLVPGFLTWGMAAGEGLHLGNIASLFVAVVFLGIMIACMIYIRKSSKTAMIIAFLIGGVSSFIGGLLMAGSMLLALVSLAAAVMMVIALVAMSTENKQQVNRI